MARLIVATLGSLLVAVSVQAQPGCFVGEIHVHQSSSLWRYDNGGETSASWYPSHVITQSGYDNVRLRILVYGVAPPDCMTYEVVSGDMSLQYRRTGGSWADVTTADTNAFQLALSDHFADGDGTTRQLCGCAEIGGGRMTESTSSFPWGVTFEEYEFEWCLRATDYAVNGTYEFRFAFPDTTYGTLPQLTFDVPDVTFTDGSTFDSSIGPGGLDQVLGRFELVGDEAGGALIAVTITLDGVRTGLSNLKLWASADAVFVPGDDIQLGSTTAADVGDGGTVLFDGFSSPVGASGMVYFLTADVAAGATGSVLPLIAVDTDLRVSGGSMSSVFTDAPLSSGQTPVAVELLSLVAE